MGEDGECSYQLFNKTEFLHLFHPNVMFLSIPALHGWMTKNPAEWEGWAEAASGLVRNSAWKELGISGAYLCSGHQTGAGRAGLWHQLWLTKGKSSGLWKQTWGIWRIL